MAASLGDLIQITDVQSYVTETCLNVYYYRCQAVGTDGAGYLDALLDAWDTDLLDLVRAIQDDDLTHTMLRAVNLSNGVDFVDRALTPAQAGTASSGEGMPSFVTLTFRLLRSTLFTRNGYKRYAGVPEGAVEENSVLASFLTAINPLAAALDDVITTAGSGEYEPVIVKRPIPSPATSYTFSSVASCDFRGIGTQNSRKAGRGV